MLLPMQTPPRVRGRAARSRRHPLAATRLLVPFAVLLVLGGGATQAAAAPAGEASAAGRVIKPMDELEVQVLARINDVRREQGVRELRVNPLLADAAIQHSLSMAEHGLFQHASADGSPWWKRDMAVYPKGKYRFWSVGENMAYASPGMTARQAIELWLASPRHRANLLSPAWREVGLGAVRAVPGSGVYEGLNVTIVTVDFGVRHS